MKNHTPCTVNVSSETGRLRAVLLHRPGVEIERMTPMNCAHALYSDILDRMNVDIDVTKTTILKLGIGGNLNKRNSPGIGDDKVWGQLFGYNPLFTPVV